MVWDFQEFSYYITEWYKNMFHDVENSNITSEIKAT